MKTPILLLSFLGAAAAPAFAAGGFDFTFPTPYHTGSSWSEAVVTGDFDGNGLQDVVSATTFVGDDPDHNFRLWLRLQQGGGGFAPPEDIVFPHHEFDWNVTLAATDLDGDGVDEILVGGMDRLSIFAYAGDGEFGQQEIPVPNGCAVIVVLRADADAHPDIFCKSVDLDATLFFGNGLGGIARSEDVATGNYGEDAATGDLDHDGDADIAIVSSSQFHVHLNDGNGRFSDGIAHAGPFAFQTLSSIAIADFDGDGRDDIAVATEANSPEATISVHVQSDSGRFTTPYHLQTLDQPRDLAAADLNGDGLADLVVGHGFNGLGRYMQSGGTLSEEDLMPGVSMRDRADTLALADLNGDGCLDAAAAIRTGVSVVTGKCFGGTEIREYAFEPQQALPIGYVANALEVVDLDHDGRQDLVVSSRQTAPDGSRTRLYFDMAQGLSNPTANPMGGSVMAIADMNQDGQEDIIVNSGLPIGMIVSGDNGYSAVDYQFNFQGQERCDRLVAFDVDLDGYPDALCHQAWSDHAYVFPSNRLGGFAQHSTLPTFGQLGTSGSAKGLGHADFNGDDVQDLVIATEVDGVGAIVVFLHDGEAGFGSPTVHKGAVPSDGNGLAIGDFTNDGLPDVAIGSTASDRVMQLFIRSASGGFAPVVLVAAASGAAPMLAADLDNNGADDLLTSNVDSVQRYMQNGGMIDTSFVSDYAITTDWGGNGNTVDMGDANGDGCNDVVAVTYTDSLTFLPGKCGAAPVGGGDDDDDDGRVPQGDAIHDFDGDGRSDVLWRNRETGANSIWPGGVHADRLRVDRVNTAWEIVGVGDVDADGRDDIVWRHATRGANAVWLAGRRATQPVVRGVSNLAWKIEAVGDFDGDGEDDLFWRNGETGRNVIWEGADAASQRRVTGVSNTHWHVVAAADFTGDGFDDLLWRNDETGANTVWRSASPVGQHNIKDLPDLGWEVVGAADFDGNGRADILWRNRGTRQTETWLGGDASSRQPLPLVGSGWQVEAVGDYDGDGFVDVAWRHLGNGRNVIWRSIDPAQQAFMTDVTDTAWEIEP